MAISLVKECLFLVCAITNQYHSIQSFFPIFDKMKEKLVAGASFDEVFTVLLTEAKGVKTIFKQTVSTQAETYIAIYRIEASKPGITAKNLQSIYPMSVIKNKVAEYQSKIIYNDITAGEISVLIEDLKIELEYIAFCFARETCRTVRSNIPPKDNF